MIAAIKAALAARPLLAGLGAAAGALLAAAALGSSLANLEKQRRLREESIEERGAARGRAEAALVQWEALEAARAERDAAIESERDARASAAIETERALSDAERKYRKALAAARADDPALDRALSMPLPPELRLDPADDDLGSGSDAGARADP